MTAPTKAPEGMEDLRDTAFNACCYRDRCSSDRARVARLEEALRKAHRAMLRQGGPTLGDVAAVEAALNHQETGQ